MNRAIGRRQVVKEGAGDILNIIEKLKSLNINATIGLPEELFLYVSSITLLVNVDLLIKDDQGRVLLTWRDDSYYGSCWHVPGGIIRFKETFVDRIHAVASIELGATVKADASPLAINQIIHPSRAVRGHFVALLFKCTLISAPDEVRRFKSGSPLPGQWYWHEAPPQNLLAIQDTYRPFFG
jgi:ADP-ribose pyrophosphatase YjhB (NUDIX family)